MWNGKPLHSICDELYDLDAVWTKPFFFNKKKLIRYNNLEYRTNLTSPFWQLYHVIPSERYFHLFFNALNSGRISKRTARKLLRLIYCRPYILKWVSAFSRYFPQVPCYKPRPWSFLDKGTGAARVVSMGKESFLIRIFFIPSTW